ncbi:MAG: hypothetical protein LBR79_00610 [Oscillospiraceae bacterium]|nr:hypothetical protein [Oscillospiraceae bacterium]
MQILPLNNINALPNKEYVLNKSKKHQATILVCAPLIIMIPTAAYVICSLCRTNTPDVDNNSWEGVSNIWRKIHSNYDKDSAEAYEALAESYRCLSYSHDDGKLVKQAQKNYQKSSAEYGKRAESKEDINSAKRAEMNAKSAECRVRLGELTWNEAANEWHKVTLTKPSYVAYAIAKEAECKAKGGSGSLENAQKYWLAVQSDKALESSFKKDCHNAYVKFATANMLTYQFLQGNAVWEEVSQAWGKTAEEDSKIPGLWFEAFAAEASVRSTDEKFSEKIKNGMV